MEGQKGHNFLFKLLNNYLFQMLNEVGNKHFKQINLFLIMYMMEKTLTVENYQK